MGYDRDLLRGFFANVAIDVTDTQLTQNESQFAPVDLAPASEQASHWVGATPPLPPENIERSSDLEAHVHANSSGHRNQDVHVQLEYG